MYRLFYYAIAKRWCKLYVVSGYGIILHHMYQPNCQPNSYYRLYNYRY